MGRLSKRFKQLNKPLDANKLIEKRFGAKDYISRPIVVVTFVAMCLYATSIIVLSGFDFSTKLYMACNDNKPCINQWHLCNQVNVDYMTYSVFGCDDFKGLPCDEPACNSEYLQPGEHIGEPPRNHSVDMIAFIGLGGILNHLWYMWRQTWHSRSK